MGWPKCRWKTSLSRYFRHLDPGADAGYPEMADDIPSMAQAGFFIRNARKLRLKSVKIHGQTGEAFDLDGWLRQDLSLTVINRKVRLKSSYTPVHA